MFYFICNLPVVTKKIGDDHQTISRRKIRWEKLDQVVYRKQIEREIGSISLNTASPSDLDVILQSFCDILVAAGEKKKTCIVLEVERINDTGLKN